MVSVNKGRSDLRCEFLLISIVEINSSSPHYCFESVTLWQWFLVVLSGHKRADAYYGQLSLFFKNSKGVVHLLRSLLVAAIT